MKILEIFKTPVAKFVLNEDLKALAKFSRQWAKNHPSVRGKLQHLTMDGKMVDEKMLTIKGGGYQSILDSKIPELQSLREQTTRCFNELGAKFFCGVPLTIATMWLNINYPHSSYEVHNHPRCCFASSFYVSVPKNSGNIVFYNNYEMENYMDNKWMTQFGTYNSSAWTLPVENNVFYVFPAWLKHRVENNNSKKNRISISINTRERSKNEAK